VAEDFEIRGAESVRALAAELRRVADPAAVAAYLL
jgi:hypothetical protein